MNQAIIHIGLPRTATTWLQNQVFPFAQNYTFIPKKVILEKLIHATPTGNAKIDWDNLHTESLPFLISEEMISGHTRAGSVNLVFLKEYLNKIRVTFNNPVIVLFLRSQYTLINSLYNLYVQKGGTYSLKKFLTPQTTLQKLYLCTNEFFNFENILSIISHYIPNENLKIYLYEELKESPFDFIQKLSADLGINFIKRDFSYSFENKSLSIVRTKTQRALNYFTKYGIPFKQYYFHLPGVYELLRKNSMNTHSGTYIDEIILKYCDQFRSSNRKIMEKYSLLSMEKYNYPL